MQFRLQDRETDNAMILRCIAITDDNSKDHRKPLSRLGVPCAYVGDLGVQYCEDHLIKSMSGVANEWNKGDNDFFSIPDSVFMTGNGTQHSWE